MICEVGLVGNAEYGFVFKGVAGILAVMAGQEYRHFSGLSRCAVKLENVGDLFVIGVAALL